jgi:hypothetical protein
MDKIQRHNSFNTVLNWSVTLRDEHRLQVFENRVLRIFRCNKGGSGRMLKKTA